MPKTEVQVDLQLLWQLWQTTEPMTVLCRRLGVSRNRLYQLAAKNKLPRRPPNKFTMSQRPRKQDDNEPHKNDPLPETIAERAAAIRAKWSDAETIRRTGQSPETTGRWAPPQYVYSERAGGFVRN